MLQFRQPTSLVRGSRHHTTTDLDADSNAMIVQIAWGFVIILGFLVTHTTLRVHQLGDELESERTAGDILASTIRDMERTNVGRAWQQLVGAQKDSQLDKLLEAWARVNATRKLFRLLVIFERPERVVLADDAECLPVGEDVTELNQEVGRLFPDTPQAVNQEALAELMLAVVREAGFPLETAKPLVDETPIPDDILDHYVYQSDRPTRENLAVLRDKIEADLRRERNQVVGLQAALLARVAAARRERLIERLAREIETGGPPADEPTGAAELTRILSGLKRTMQLLPEVERQVREGREEAVAMTHGAPSK